MTNVHLLVILGLVTSGLGVRIGIMMSATPPYLDYPSLNNTYHVVEMAVAEIEQRNVTVNVTYQPTECDEAAGMVGGYKLANTNPMDVIIGPACSKVMDLVTKLISAINTNNIPTITWLPRHQSNTYPNGTAVSTYATFEDLTSKLVTVLKHFSWRIVGIISTSDEICTSLVEAMNDLFPNKDISILRLSFIDDVTNQGITTALNEVTQHARIIIVCLPASILKQFLFKADELGLSADKYVFVYCRFGPTPAAWLTSGIARVTSDDERILRTLLQVSFMDIDPVIYADFTNNITKMANNITKMGFNNQLDEFAASLYDTMMYVGDIFMTNVSRNQHYFNYNASLARDIHTLSGTVHVDPSGRIPRKVTVYHYQDNGFQAVGHVTNVYSITATSLRWPTGSVPLDTPRCGWEGGDCTDAPANDRQGVIIGSSISSVIIIILAVGAFIVYRKTKFEKELLSMIWKVNRSEIKMRRPRANTINSTAEKSIHPKKRLIRADTRGTLGLGSTSSIDKSALYAPVGSYKGAIVAVKNIQRRSISLTREMLRDLKALRELQHENLNPFIGVSLEPGNSYILTKYCAKGSLQDVLENDDIQLDNMFKMSFLMDLARGLDFLHKSAVRSHGNLKSTNCVIDSRWVLKLTDYGAINQPMEEEPSDMEAEHEYYSRLLWCAPELLRMQKKPPKGTQKGDVYSFSIIMQEILTRCPPFYFNSIQSYKTIINRLRNKEEPPFRPRLPDESDVTEKMCYLMGCCWQESPDLRPDVHAILKMLIDINGKRKINILDNMIMMLEAYSNNLEELVANRTTELAIEKQKTDTLLYQMLPPLVAEQLKRGEHVIPETFNEASIFFSDIVGFTCISGNSTPLQVIDLLNDLYTTMDEIIGMHDVYKVETIGDAYMVSSGIPRRNGKRHTGEIANMALDLLSASTSFRIRHIPGEKLQLRIGLHTGSCAAGVVGLTMPRYCLFGDTVNMASRMESTGKAFHIHISEDMSSALKDLDWGFIMMERGLIEVKGKGLQKTYWLLGKKGYTNTMPEETERLHQDYKACMAGERPMSPTDTHISMDSKCESTSMYGNAFRRASLAIRFIRTLSANSRENSPYGSRLTIQDTDNKDDDVFISASTLNIPKLKGSELKLPNGTATNTSESSNMESSAPVRRKKKKKKSKRREKHERSIDPGLEIPTIKITEQMS